MIQGEGQHLAIRVRQTFGAGGDASSRMSVYCPLRRRSSPVSECLGCSACGGVKVDPLQEELWVRCKDEGATALGSSCGGCLLEIHLRSVMTRTVVCVSPDLPVEDLAQLFIDRNINGAPVVDSEGRAVGIVSKSDLVRAIWGREGPDGAVFQPTLSSPPFSTPPLPAGLVISEPLASAQVRTLMMPVAFTLFETSTVRQAAALMSQEGVHRVPVVSEDAAVVGIVSALDVLRVLAQAHHAI